MVHIGQLDQRWHKRVNQLTFCWPSAAATFATTLQLFSAGQQCLPEPGFALLHIYAGRIAVSCKFGLEYVLGVHFHEPLT
jgi:hypothetical protein